MLTSPTKSTAVSTPIDGRTVFGTGIINEGTVDTGQGDDFINGVGGEGIFNADSGKIKTGQGDDSITASSQLDRAPGGITNQGTIDTGRGDDFIGIGPFFNGGTIDTGQGNDSIVAFSAEEGIFNGGTIDLGEGNDLLKGFGTGVFGEGQGILNTDRIDTGQGKDLIEAVGLIGIANSISDTVGESNLY